MNITVSAYNRPAYLSQTLSAISRMVGVHKESVVVLLDPCEETEQCRSICRAHDVRAMSFSQHVGCNDAIYACLAYGFEHMGSEYHVHFEDDTVPTHDALRWFSWACEQYRHDSSVFTVTGYNRISNENLSGCGVRRWFTPWGWATWRDRWLEMRGNWSHGNGVSWDCYLTDNVRNGRYEAFPTVSRIQNIGAERGTHVPNAEWHTANHRVPVTADDLAGDPVLAWVQTREDDRADHS